MPGDEDDRETQDTVRRMLREIKEGGEEVARSYAEMLDNYTGSVVLSEEEIQEQIQELPVQEMAVVRASSLRRQASSRTLRYVY